MDNPFKERKEISFEFYGMQLKYKRKKTILKNVGQRGAKIESGFFSMTIPPRAISELKNSVSLGFTVYAFDRNESKEVPKETVITDLLVFHPCGAVFENDVTVTLGHNGMVSADSEVALLYGRRNEDSFCDTWAPYTNNSTVRVSGCNDMKATFYPNFIEINTRHFCWVSGVLVKCDGHKFRVLAYETLKKTNKKTINIHFTSNEYAQQIREDNKGRELYADINVDLWFTDKAYKLIAKEVTEEIAEITEEIAEKLPSGSWKIENKFEFERPLQDSSMRTALELPKHESTRILKLQMTRDDAEDPEFTVRVTAGDDDKDASFALEKILEKSSEPKDSTRKPADKNEKVLKVLSLCDEWGSSKGGLSTFNRFFCKEGLAMAKIEGYDRVEVRCRVNDYDSCDCDVKLTSEKAPVYAKEFKPDLVISHSTVTGDKGLEVQKECGEMTKRVHFVHTWPRDLERVKEQPDGAIKADKKVKREQAFIEGAAAVAAVGPYLAEKWHSELAPVKSNDGPGDKFPKVFDVTPGLICPVDKNQIQRETKGILCLGRLTDGEVKGVDIVVKAAASFRKKEKGSSDGKVEFVFRGIPEDEVAETERKLCQETGISQKRTGNDSETIDVKPYATPDEIRGDYDRASVVVMPSSAEGFGLVALEALSRGTPVIVSKGCGFAKAIIKAAHEHLSPEDSDWLEKWIFKIERGTEEDIQKSGETLMKKIESVLSNSSSYEHARKLKTAYEKTFTWKKSAENLLKAIF
eukprot:m.208984 g.208984  ORF g.208984 m.208984 type:complete len:751 (+) comp39723_c0_seq13:398-2650(+)